MQFGFMPGYGTTDVIFAVRQVQETYIRKNQNLFFAFADLEKPLNRTLEIPRNALGWTLQKVRMRGYCRSN